jgi:hypothetical protein
MAKSRQSLATGGPAAVSRLAPSHSARLATEMTCTDLGRQICRKKDRLNRYGAPDRTKSMACRSSRPEMGRRRPAAAFRDHGHHRHPDSPGRGAATLARLTMSGSTARPRSKPAASSLAPAVWLARCARVGLARCARVGFARCARTRVAPALGAPVANPLSNRQSAGPARSPSPAPPGPPRPGRCPTACGPHPRAGLRRAARRTTPCRETAAPSRYR